SQVAPPAEPTVSGAVARGAEEPPAGRGPPTTPDAPFASLLKSPGVPLDPSQAASTQTTQATGSRPPGGRVGVGMWSAFVLSLGLACGAWYWVFRGPAPAAAPRGGVVRLTSDPDGAWVWLDGRPLPSPTPCEIS